MRRSFWIIQVGHKSNYRKAKGDLRQTEEEKRRWCGDGGKEWSAVITRPKVSNHQKLGKVRNGISPRASGWRGLANALISDSGFQNTERINFCFLSHWICDNLLLQPQGTNTWPHWLLHIRIICMFAMKIKWVQWVNIHEALGRVFVT